MTNLILTKKAPKVQLTPAQKTFDRLKKKIKALQAQLEKTKDNLDIMLHFNYSHIEPARKTLLHTVSEFIKIIYSHYKKPKLFSKNDRDILKELLRNKIDDIIVLGYELEDEKDLEIESIIKKLVDSKAAKHEEDMMSEMMDFFKDQMMEAFGEAGVDIDLSDIDSTDNEEEMLHKLFEAMNEAKENQKKNKDNGKVKPKTKSQLQKEMKEKELENLQKQGLSKIYKDLAKAIHPDLEQDPIKKLEKEEVMKRLTTAYKNEDLHELLKLELEWMSQSENNGVQNKKQSDDQLKIYNSILKDQINELEGTIELMFLHPRYAPLRSFQTDKINLPLLQKVLGQFNKDIENHQSIIKDLSSPYAVEMVRQIINASV